MSPFHPSPFHPSPPSIRPALVVAAFALFVLFRYVRFAQAEPALLAFSGVAGAVQLAAAVWATATVAELAATLVRARVLSSGACNRQDVIFRTAGGRRPSA